MTWVRSVLIVLACTLAFAACGDSSSADSAASGNQDVQVADFRLVETPSGQRQVMGTLQNKGTTAIAGVQIKVSLFDANNVRIETMSVTVSDEIPAAGEMQFKKPLTTEAAVHGARVHSVLVM
jgi:ABC-type glycerol-3-phosphate transport system substrate-binding protein